MKQLLEYVLQNKTISSINEYLLSKNNKQFKDTERNELVDKLYKEFGDYGEFEKIKDNGTFYMLVDNEDELRLNFPPEIVKLAKVEKAKQGMGEMFATWNIDDIIEFFNYDYKKVFSIIKDWFDYSSGKVVFGQ